jgi:hypothetical protein
MAKKQTAISKKSQREERNTKAAMSALVKSAEADAGFAIKVRKKYDAITERAKEQNSVTRTITTDLSASAAAHGINELFGLGARAIGEWSQRTVGSDGHFSKNIAYYSSLPQTALGATVYIIELATRNPNMLMPSLGREIASKAANLLVNLGLANTIRAIRYQLSRSIDEDQESGAEKNALLNKIADLQKQVEARK